MSIDAFIQNVFGALLAQETYAARVNKEPAQSRHPQRADEVLGTTMLASSRLTELVDGGELAHLLRALDSNLPPLKVSRVLGPDMPYLVECLAQPLEQRRAPEQATPAASDALRAQLTTILKSRPDLCALIEAYVYLEHNAFRLSIETWLCSKLETALTASAAN